MPESSQTSLNSDTAVNDYFDKHYLSLVSSETRGTACSQQADFLLSYVPANLNCPVLDHCCGHGRHLKALAAGGYINLTGLDISEYFISIARAQLPLATSLFCGDAKSFVARGTFGFIYNIESSFNCFTPQEAGKVLKNIKCMLAEDGIFIIHVFNPGYLIKKLPAALTSVVDNVQSFEERLFDEENEIVTVRQTHRVKQTDGIVSQKKTNISLFMYNIDTLTRLLVDAGFAIESTYGDFHKNTFDGDTSPNIILVCMHKR